MNFFFSERCGRTRLIATCFLNPSSPALSARNTSAMPPEAELLDDAVALLLVVRRLGHLDVSSFPQENGHINVAIIGDLGSRQGAPNAAPRAVARSRALAS